MQVQSFRFKLADGMQLAADAYGSSKDDVVVLLHGGGQTRHSWEETARELGKAGWRAIVVDLRGHGQSAWDSAGRYQVEDFVRDVGGILEQLATPAVLVGASIGGIAALLAQAEHESLCRALVLVDVTPRLEAKGVFRIIDFMSAAPRGFSSLDEAAAAVAAYLPHRKNSSNLEGLKKNLRQAEDGRFYWHWDPKLLEVWDPQRYTPEQGVKIMAERLAAAEKIRVPTLLIRGKMSDVVSEETAREFLQHVPHAEYVDLEGAAHMVAGDQNDIFTSALVDFLQRLKDKR